MLVTDLVSPLVGDRLVSKPLVDTATGKLSPCDRLQIISQRLRPHTLWKHGEQFLCGAGAKILDRGCTNLGRIGMSNVSSISPQQEKVLSGSVLVSSAVTTCS